MRVILNTEELKEIIAEHLDMTYNVRDRFSITFNSGKNVDSRYEITDLYAEATDEEG